MWPSRNITRRALLRQSGAGSLAIAGLAVMPISAKAQPIRSVAESESAAAAQLSVEQIGDRVAYQILRQPEFRPGYTYDIQLEALLCWGEASVQPGLLEFVRQVSQGRRYPPGYDQYSYELQMFSCLPFELHKRFVTNEHVAPFLTQTRKYRSEILRSFDGIAVYYLPEFAISTTRGIGRVYLNSAFTPILVDHTQEYASRLAKAGAVSGDMGFYRECADQFERLSRAMRDSATGLWNHGRGFYGSARSVTTTKWARGQAWILRGMVESLTHLPSNSAEHTKVRRLMIELVDALLRYQDSEGLWHQVVDLPASYQETSATAFIGYYLARAIQQELLPEQPYRDASRKAFDALTRHKISADGRVYGTCEVTPPFPTLEYYLQRETPVNDPHGVATVLLCASGQLLLSSNRAIPWMDH